MVKLFGPCLSLGGGFPIRKERKKWPPYVPPAEPPVNEDIPFDVLFVGQRSWGEQDVIDGTYIKDGYYGGKTKYIATYQGHLWWSPAASRWMIALEFGQEVDIVQADVNEQIISVFTGTGLYEGCSLNVSDT